MEEQLLVLYAISLLLSSVIVRKLHVYRGRQHHRSDTIILISAVEYQCCLKIDYLRMYFALEHAAVEFVPAHVIIL